jgi:hypothetical protein
MKLVHVALAVAPYGPNRPEARVTAELPPVQRGRGMEVSVLAAAPSGSVEDFASDARLARRITPLRVTLGQDVVDVPVLEGMAPGGSGRLVLLVVPGEGEVHRSRFAEAALEFLAGMPDRPELVHLHGDTGLQPEVLRERLGGTSVVLSVYDHEGCSAGFVKAVEDADAVVVPCTAMASPGPEADAVGRALGARRSGVRVVPPGLDPDSHDPRRDPVLSEPYGPEDLGGKDAARRTLQSKVGFSPRRDVPLVTFLGSAEDVGDGLLVAMTAAAELDLQLVVLGPASLQPVVLAAASPTSRIAFLLAADPPSFRAIIAGSDAVILPAPVAPLATEALVALRYATVPVARRVDAHRDRLVEFDAESGTGGAFLFDQPEELFHALRRLRNAFAEGAAWATLCRRNASVECDWSRPTALLSEIYHKLLRV